MSARPQIFFRARFSTGNFGDWILNRNLVRELSAHGDVLVDMSDAPRDFGPLLGTAVRLIPSSTTWLVTMLRASLLGAHPVYFVMIPGHVYATGDGGIRRQLRRALRGVAFAALDAARIRLVRFGLTFGPFSPQELTAEAALARRLSYFGLRDDGSLALARSLGLSAARSCPDLALLDQEYWRPADGVLREKRLLFSFRGSSTTGSRDLSAHLIEHARAVAASLPSDWTLGCIAQVAEDQQLAATLARELGCAVVPSFDGSIASGDGVASQYTKAQIVVTNRLHAFLFALLSGAMAIAVVDKGEHGKIVGVLADVGLAHLLVPLGDRAALTALVERLRRDFDDERRHVVAAFAGARARLVQSFEEAFRSSTTSA